MTPSEIEPGKPLPLVSYLVLPEDGEPYLSGAKCLACGEVFVGDRMACANCGARDRFAAVKLKSHGELYAYTVVYRSFPGVKTPFVSAIVDLDGGGTIKGTMINIKPDPNAITMGMAVEVIFQDAGVADAAGHPRVGFFIQPATGEGTSHG